MTESIEPIVMKEETPDTPLEEDISLEAVNEVETEEATPSLPDSAQELETLRQEVEQLRAALVQKEQEQQNALREIGEFHRLFPDISIENVPEGVWDSVEQGIPLSAAYALYEKKRCMSEARADEINRRNASLSAGKAGKHTAGEYFSPDEVRAMSQRQVHNNYRAIMESMKHWH